MAYITVPISYDDSLKFYPSGNLKSISTTSQVMGTRSLPNDFVIPGATNNATFIDYLRVKTKEIGDIYLNMSLAAYNSLIQVAEVDANAPYVFAQNVTSASSITDAAFYNIVLVQVTKATQVQTLSTFTYTSNDDGTGTITFPSPLTGIMQFLYYKL